VVLLMLRQYPYMYLMCNYAIISVYIIVTYITGLTKTPIGVFEYEAD